MKQILITDFAPRLQSIHGFSKSAGWRAIAEISEILSTYEAEIRLRRTENAQQRAENIQVNPLQ